MKLNLRAAYAALRGKAPALSSVDRRGSSDRGWLTLFDSGEQNMGDWQKDIRLEPDAALAFFAAFVCVTRPASDIAKLCLRLMEKQASGIWAETTNPAYSPFLRRPNGYQTMQQFVETWVLSKLARGNTLALKERDERSVVVKEHVLDWDRVTPLVSESGMVFYQLQVDQLAGVPYTEGVTVPASEVIHDRFNCIFHPLVGVSPLYASSLAARQGLEIQKNSARFFANMSRPSGILTAPGKISDETALRLKNEWETNFGRGKIGKVAVLGDALKYEAMAVTPVDAELTKQLDLSAKQICAAFGVPFFMAGGEVKTENVEALWQIYYSQCLQSLIEAFERLQDDGLGLDPAKYRTEFDLDDLLRMDSKTLAEVEGVKVQRGISAPNESRRKFNLAPVTGGAKPYLQQQNYSLEALAKRDASDDPFKTAPAPAAPKPAAEEDDEKDTAQEEVKSLQAKLQVAEFRHALQRRIAEATR